MLLKRFFVDETLDQLRPGLDQRAQGLIKGILGFCLRANQSLESGLPLMTDSFRLLYAAGDQIHACGIAGYVSETLRTLGRLTEARRWALQSTQLADSIRLGDRVGHLRQQVYHRTTLADITRFQGEFRKARALFDESMSLLPSCRLTSIPSVRWCELLLDLEQYDEVRRQTALVLDDDRQQLEAVSAGLHRLYLCYATFAQAGGNARSAGLEEMNGAIQALDEAGLVESQALGQIWLARALREAGELTEAGKSALIGLRLSQSCGAKATEVDGLCELAAIQLRRRQSQLPAKLEEVRRSLRSVQPFVTMEYRRKEQEVLGLIQSLGACSKD